jgi:hypothetical protein
MIECPEDSPRTLGTNMPTVINPIFSPYPGTAFNMSVELGCCAHQRKELPINEFLEVDRPYFPVLGPPLSKER